MVFSLKIDKILAIVIISFLSLTKIAVALDAVNGIKALFTEVPYQSIEEVINEQK